ncbi:hypothetical protein EXIGLDRAFT_766259 [Exidia glandulosa HHB12029]|uniref:DUF6535 domain-containing protein n=1 Tax=Exidia glandulosa HHB12029 TaxID=1314781 RepID=A0A165JUD0_EXIGL|nr:hypothetical protein EXIGLDRAFT_766259 [Exidia glandulosa HHB12029]
MTDIIADTHSTHDHGVADDGEHRDTTSPVPRLQDQHVLPDYQRYSPDVLYPPEELDTPFKQKYPPDPFGGEMDENAPVWKVYQDTATIQDGALLDAWNKTLDILLIFAGLFSAVITAFIIESYRLLQPDFQEYTARALQVLVSMHNGSGILDPVHPLSDPSLCL